MKGPREALLAAAACLFALAAAEGLCRIFQLGPGFHSISITNWGAEYRFSEDRELLYEPKPGSGRFNAAGYIGPLYGRPRPGQKRIALLGDSVLYGVGVDELRTFAALFRRRHEAECQVLNFAVPGYDLTQYVRLLETRVLPYRPDAAIIAVCFNDGATASGELNFLMEEARRKGSSFIQSHLRQEGWRRELLRSQLYRFVRFSVLGRRSAGTEDPPAPSYELSGRRYQDLGRRLLAVQEKHGVAIRFILLPAAEAARSRELGAIRSGLEPFGFELWDLHRELHGSRPPGSIRSLFLAKKDIWHYNEKGHEQLFQAIEAGRGRLKL